MNKMIVLVLLTLITVLNVAIAEEDIVKLKIITPIAVPKTKDVTAMFSDLTPEAASIGLNETQLLGNIGYEKLDEVRTRLNITWHTLSKPAGRKGGKVQEQLDNALYSRFVVDTKRVDPNTEITAMGDIESLLVDVEDANKRINRNEKVEIANRDDQKDKKEKDKDIPESNFGNTGGYAGNTQNYDDTTSGGTNNNADIQKPSYEDCPARIDMVNRKVYEQKRMNMVGSTSGEIFEIGECTDTDITVDFQLVAEDCGTINDAENDKILQLTKTIASLKGERIDIEGCVLNPGFESEPRRTIQICDPRIDVASRKVYEQHRLNSVDENNSIFRQTECEDSGVSADFKFAEEDCGTINDAENDKIIQLTKTIATLDGDRIEIEGCAQNPGFENEPRRNIQECDLRIDVANSKVFKQQRLVSVDENNSVFNQTECADSGVSGDIEYVIEECGIVPDYINSWVIQKTKMIATVEGDRIDIEGCAINPGHGYTLISTMDGCGLRHDFEGGVSVPQERFYYLDSFNAEVEIAACRDSNIVFNHYTSEDECTDDISYANNEVIPFDRVAYNNTITNSIEYATACTPKSSVSLDVTYCSPKYEHDMVNNVSYYITEFSYIHPDRGRISVSACTRSNVRSFAHMFEASNCADSNDDSALTTTFRSIRLIDTPDDGVIEISPCTVQSVLPYQLTSTINVRTSAVVTIDANVPDMSFCNVSGLTYLGVITPNNSVNPQVDINGTTCNVYRSSWNVVARYLRGDGTQYNKIIQTYTNMLGSNW